MGFSASDNIKDEGRIMKDKGVSGHEMRDIVCGCVSFSAHGAR